MALLPRCAQTAKSWKPILAMVDALLTVEELDAGYPGKQILFGIAFSIGQGEVVTLLGANGSGKSTVLKAISGFVRPRRGSVPFFDQAITGLPPHATFRARVDLCS